MIRWDSVASAADIHELGTRRKLEEPQIEVTT
jgi:hypothetical protein